MSGCSRGCKDNPKGYGSFALAKKDESECKNASSIFPIGTRVENSHTGDIFVVVATRYEEVAMKTNRGTYIWFHTRFLKKVEDQGDK